MFFQFNVIINVWGGDKLDEVIFLCKGVRGAPGDMFDFQRRPRAFSCNLRHIGYCLSLSRSPVHKEPLNSEQDDFS